MDDITKMNFNAISEALKKSRSDSDNQHKRIDKLEQTIGQLQQQIGAIQAQNAMLMASKMGTGPTAS